MGMEHLRVAIGSYGSYLDVDRVIPRFNENRVRVDTRCNST